MSYVLEFAVNMLPKSGMANARGNWRVRYGHAKTIKRAVWKAVWPYRPPEPLERAKLTLTRYSSVRPDFDNLAISFKHVVDGLVENGILKNDKHENIGQPVYLWEKAKPGMGHIRVRVEAA